MRLSISIQSTDSGFVPRIVLQTPKGFQIFPVGEPCSTFQEAWIVAKTVRALRT